jgi:hypothetical protein
VWAVLAAAGASAVEVRILLPLGRTAYQTNERIEVSVLRTSSEALPASQFKLTLAGDDGSRAALVFPSPPVAMGDKDARTTEHFYLNGALLRPGHYKLEVSVNDAQAAVEMDVFSHVRKSSFRTFAWGTQAEGVQQEAMGEDGLGFNLMYGKGWGDWSVRAGVDWMQCCIQSGGHQMDLRQECDWSDPYVLRGGTARLSQAAFYHRLQPNAVGLHCYDEPGLSWCKDPQTGQMVPHLMPSQHRAFRSAHGEDAIRYDKVDPNNPDDVARWVYWANWKLSFMDGAWKLARFATEYVRPDYITATQSQYGWSAYADGYYFNVARSLPVTSGHGGYDDFGPEYFNPSYFLEIARARDLAKPEWYLPCWYSSTTADRFRMEQYLSFMTNLQGMGTPPDITVHVPSGVKASEAVVQTNKLFQRLGTVFTTMPVTRPPVAMLYSMSQNLHAQARNMEDNYTGGGQREALVYVYLAGKVSHIPMQTVVDEDITDGTLTAHHKAVVLTAIHYLDPKVVAGLEAFASSGGLVLLTGDCTVQVKGAVKLPARAEHFDEANLRKLREAKDSPAVNKLCSLANLIRSAEPLAKAMAAELKKIGVEPPIQCDNPGIVVSRQAEGDIEYLFLVNAAHDDNPALWNGIKPTVATVVLPNDGRPIYDAVLGGEARCFKPGKPDGPLTATLRFGPGQMRVFARTARQIVSPSLFDVPERLGGVKVATPTILRDYTLQQSPIRLQIGAVLADRTGRVLAGSAPLHVRVVDPLGAARYDLYRATAKGMYQETLQLGVNEPAGQWKVVVRDLLAGSEDQSAFSLTPPAQCGALAGAAHRAIWFDRDRQNIFRFFRLHKNVTIVTGSSPYNAAAAQRLTDILRPWDIQCKVVSGADANKPRNLSAEEALTWCGMTYAGRGQIKPGGQNPPVLVGFAVREPAILLGSPEDNPLIAFLRKERFLPYAPKADELPGRGRGMLAWQRDGVGYEQESITLIAHDAEGMAEAVGTLYEALAGLDRLTEWRLPVSNSLAPASKAPPQAPQAAVKWQVVLPDRAVEVRPLADGRFVVLSVDGTLAVIDGAGGTAWETTIPGGEFWSFDASANGQTIAVGTTLKLCFLDAAGKKLAEPAIPARPVVEGIARLAVSPDGGQVAVAFADGGVAMFSRDGKPGWSLSGMSPDQIAKWEQAVREWDASADQRAAELKAWDEKVKQYEADLKAWESIEGNKAPKPVKPERPRQPGRPAKPQMDPAKAMAFSSDGKTLLVLSSKSQVLGAADGQALGEVGASAAGRTVIVPNGNEWLVTEGRDRLLRISCADGKTLGQVSSPTVMSEKKRLPNNVVGAAAVDGGVLMATESDWTIRKLKGVEGKLEDQTVWIERVDRRIVKKLVVREGLAAVAYWGGTLRVLDKDGKVKAVNVFDQDIADVAWAAGDLIVALADGRIVRVGVK